jgi:hypothetical protein
MSQRFPQSQQRMILLLRYPQRSSRIKLVIQQHYFTYRVTSPDGGSSPRRNPVRALFESSSGISRDVRTQLRCRVSDSAPMQKNPRGAKLDVSTAHLWSHDRSTTRAAAGRQVRGIHTTPQLVAFQPPTPSTHSSTIMKSTQGQDSRDHNIMETKSQDCARKIAALPANTAFIRTPDVLTLMILPAELRVKVRSNFPTFPVLTSPCSCRMKMSRISCVIDFACTVHIFETYCIGGVILFSVASCVIFGIT